MTVSLAGRTRAGAACWSLALLSCLCVVWWGAAASEAAQSDPRAAANQLHAAIVNGDVESLRYWLDIRHADVSAATAAEPDVSPLERCVGLAARTLDGSSAAGREAPVVGLRALQDMAALLHAHGARLTSAERSQFPEPVLRWYDDAVSTPAAPATKRPEPIPPPPTADASGKSAITLSLATVLVQIAPRESCNGSGHAVYLVNQRNMSVTASVTIHEDAAGTTDGRQKSETLAVDAESSWRLGCDVSTDRRSVRYVLTNWR
jgi:hypothetical protein